MWDSVLLLVVGTVISWVSLMIIVPIAQAIASFSMPPWPETMGKLAIVALVGNVLAVILEPINTFLSWVVGGIVFFYLMYRWFDVDVFGAIVIVVVSWVVRALLVLALIGFLAGLLN